VLCGNLPVCFFLARRAVKALALLLCLIPEGLTGKRLLTQPDLSQRFAFLWYFINTILLSQAMAKLKKKITTA